MPYEDEDASNSRKSGETPLPEHPTGGSKRRKPSPKDQESPGGNEDAKPKPVKQRKMAPTHEDAAMKGEDAESRSTKPVRRRPTRRSELKAEIIESRDEERQRADRAEASIEKLKTKIKELSSRSEQQAEKIKRLEISKLAVSGQDRVYLQDDGTIRGNIALLFAKISAWALNWAHEDFFLLHMDRYDIGTAVEMLQGKSKYLETRVLRENASAECIWATAGCRLATEAFLANTIAKLFLARPFNFLKRNKSARDANIEGHIHEVCDGMKGEPLRYLA